MAAVVVTATAVLLGAGSVAQAAVESRPADTYVTNGSVDAVLPTADATYIGGTFTEVGPRTGPGVGIDTAAANDTGLAQVDGGRVRAVAKDGSGGYYVGGEFTHVGGLPRRNLAHILPNGSVDPNFKPNSSGGVRALAVAGSTVYVGGNFTSIGGEARRGIAALDRTTGRATAWNPHASSQGYTGDIDALAVSGSTVYAGGGFDHIGGEARSNIAALDRSTGRATDWNPDAGRGEDPVVGNGGVSALVVTGSTIYVGGRFDHIGGEARSSIAAIDRTTGHATAWNPSAGGGTGACGHGPPAGPSGCLVRSVNTLTVVGSTVYVGGGFSSIGGEERQSIAALDRTTGQATAWNPNVGGTVYALAVSGSTVYAGGYFDSIGGEFRDNIAAIDRTTGHATAWNPHLSGSNRYGPHFVNALAVSGSTVYVGGNFTSIGVKARNHIAALDPTTGRPTAWNPGVSGARNTYIGPSVNALAVSGSTLYVGGYFTSIGDEPRNSIAAVDRSTGGVTSWNPNADTGYTSGGIRALAVSGSTIYVGGNFTSIGGETRQGIAALDRTTGQATAWNPNPSGDFGAGSISALAVIGSTVYVGGSFSSIGGQTRHSLAALDRTTGEATAWNPNASDPPYGPSVDELVVSGPTAYVGGSFERIGSLARNNIAAIDRTTGQATSWDPNASDSVRALAVSGSTVYVGGDFRHIGGKERHCLAALDATTGLASDWGPGANGGVDALAFGPDGSLWAGGGFTGFRRSPQAGIARFKP